MTEHELGRRHVLVAPLAVSLGLVVAALSSQTQPDCLDFDRYLATGGTLELTLDDVVLSLFGLVDATGALRLESTNQHSVLSVISRTYNRTADGTFGQFIAAQSWHASVNVADHRRGGGIRTLLHLAKSDGYRSNVGFVEVLGLDAEIELEMIDSLGTSIATGAITVPAFSHRQINDVFAAVNAPWQSNCRVELRIVNFFRCEGLFAYASVIDNRSGDPVYLPAFGAYWAPEPRLELSNRDNAVLIDQLAEAVGTEKLPEGTFTAAVAGAGDLGRPDLPIRVLCLYVASGGELGSAALAVGERVEGVVGGSPFWCVIPDWIDRDDNHGEVTVALSGGADDVLLTLDAQANAVLLDDLVSSVVLVRPASETYRLVTTGDLGGPSLEPRAVVMHRDRETGQLQVRALGHGEVVERVDGEFQLLAAVTDWISRSDNTGTTTVEPACTTRAGACGSVVTGAVSDTDCDVTLRGWHDSGERITFDGVTGQTVTITATWESPYAALCLADPAGTLIDGCEESSGDDNQAVIADVTLPETGTYTVWALGGGWENRYTIEISCQNP